MTKKDHKDFENSAKCWICKKENEEGEVKVIDHDRITGKNLEYAHQDWNQNLSLSEKFPVVFHNCKAMIHILSFKKLAIEKYVSSTIQQSKKKSIDQNIH